jgi:hypothetical protein
MLSCWIGKLEAGEDGRRRGKRKMKDKDVDD